MIIRSHQWKITIDAGTIGYCRITLHALVVLQLGKSDLKMVEYVELDLVCSDAYEVYECLKFKYVCECPVVSSKLCSGA